MKRYISLMLPVVLWTSSACADRWTVDHAKSRLGFTVQWSAEPFTATFKSWTADIEFDPKNLSHAQVTVDINLGSEASDTPENDDGLKGPEGFSVAQFPIAHFVATKFVHKGDDSYVSIGTLSLHGVTKSLELPFKLRIDGRVAHVTAKAQVLRTDFGLGRGEWAAPTPIAHEVTIDVDLTAARAP